MDNCETDMLITVLRFPARREVVLRELTWRSLADWCTEPDRPGLISPHIAVDLLRSGPPGRSEAPRCKTPGTRQPLQ